MDRILGICHKGVVADFFSELPHRMAVYIALEAASFGDSDPAPPSGEWISARQALKYFEDQGESRSIAIKSLCRVAYSRVAVRAERIGLATTRRDFIHGLERKDFELERLFDPGESDSYWRAINLQFFGRLRSYGEGSDRGRSAWILDGVNAGSWVTGDFEVELCGHQSELATVVVQGLQFDKQALSCLLGIDRETPSTIPAAIVQGGRPAGKHGHAIARVTLRLLDLPTQTLETLTAASAGEELRTEYRKLGEKSPTDKNLEKFGAGILEAIRERSKTL